MNLYEIETEIQELSALIEQHEGEVGPELFEAVDALKDAAENKMHGLVRYCAVLKQEAESAKQEAKRINELAKAREAKYKSVKQYLQWAVDTFRDGKYKDEGFSLSVGKAGGAKALKITGEVPEVYKVQVMEVDKEAIKAALLEGDELTFAHFEEKKTILRGV